MIALHRRQPRRDGLDDRGHVGLEGEEAVFGVVDDVDQLVGEQPGVQRVQHAAGARHAIPDRHVPRGVPGHHADPVSGLRAEPRQSLRDPKRLAPQRRPCGLDLRPLGAGRHDPPPAMEARRMIDDPRHPQRPVLHLPEHPRPPLSSLPLRLGRIARERNCRRRTRQG
jgi:hypothetical protein